MSTSGEPDYRFWWFITRRCNRNCRHCLRHGIGDAGDEFDAPTCRRLLDDWIDWLVRHGKTSSIEFGGANPLLREDLPDLLRRSKAAADAGVFTPGIRILANPETLTPEYARLLADCGVNDMPMSLDGLEATNDAMRGTGNFAACLRALDLLVAAGIGTSVKFTALKGNWREYGAVRDLARAHGVTRVVPGRLILDGGGRSCADQALSDDEWRTFLDTFDVKPLFPPCRDGRRFPFRPGGHFVIMAGGEFRPTRRDPPLGRYPRDSFDDLIPRLPMEGGTR